MINAIARQLHVPETDYTLTVGETLKVRVANALKKLRNSSFFLEVELQDGTTVEQEAEMELCEKDIHLGFSITESMLKVPGTVLVYVMAKYNNQCIWASYKGILFVNGQTNSPADFREKLKGLELAQIEEANRRAAEKTREESEKARTIAESARVAAESARVTAEKARNDSETERASAERARADAESARVEAEKARADAENARVEAEKARVTEESARVEAEKARVKAEEDRNK